MPNNCAHVYGCCNGMDGYVELIEENDSDYQPEGGKDIEWFDFCPKCGERLESSDG